MPRTARTSSARGREAEEKEAEAACAASFREERGDGWFRPHALHPWADAAVTGDPGHVPARRAVAVDGKERKLAKAGGKKKVYLLAAVTHVPSLVIAQDKVAKSGKANEISHFKPLLAPLPLDDALITADAMQANRDNALFLRKAKKAHYLWPILGNQPGLNAQPNALPWKRPRPPPPARSAAAASRPAPSASCPPPGAPASRPRQAVLIERYTTYKKKGQWLTRAEAVLYITSLGAEETTPEDLLAHARGHWRVEHAHWLRDVIWKEDKSLIRTGNAPQIWSALTNLVITLFRIHGVTSYTAETRHCAQDPRHALQLLDLTGLSPG